jgi:hypothetical protein
MLLEIVVQGLKLVQGHWGKPILKSRELITDAIAHAGLPIEKRAVEVEQNRPYHTLNIP